MAVIFVHLFIYKTYYVSSKYTTSSSVNYSKNNYTCCHVIILLWKYFLHDVMRISIINRTSLFWRDSNRLLTIPSSLNEMMEICLSILCYHIWHFLSKHFLKSRKQYIERSCVSRRFKIKSTVSIGYMWLSD